MDDIVCTRIKELREQNGITQKALAELLQIAPPSVSNWEHGKTKPTRSNLQVLAGVFGVTIDYLLGNEREIDLQINSPSKNELMELLAKFQGLPDPQFDMLVSLMNFFISIHEDNRVRYTEISLLQDYGNYLQYVLSDKAEKEQKTKIKTDTSSR